MLHIHAPQVDMFMVQPHVNDTRDFPLLVTHELHTKAPLAISLSSWAPLAISLSSCFWFMCVSEQVHIHTKQQQTSFIHIVMSCIM